MTHHDTLTQALQQIAMAAEATVCNPAWIAKHARAALSTPAQGQQSIDAEALIRAVLPGGSSCDPQTVADEIRRYLGQWPGQASTFAEYMGCDTDQAQQSEPAKPLFASKVAARKWAELQDDGARMQSIAFDGHKSGQPGTIDPWGVVLWDQAQQAGEPVAWRWRNCVGDWVTGWLDYKPSQRACIEQQVTEAGGIIQYAYATTPPAHAQPAAQPVQGVPQDKSDAAQILAAELRGNVAKKDYLAWALQVLPLLDWLTFSTISSPTPPAQQGEPVGCTHFTDEQISRALNGTGLWIYGAQGGEPLYRAPQPAVAQPAGDVVRDAERWRKARDLLAVEDIERAIQAKAAFGGGTDEAESLKADAAIDAALASSARKGE